AAGPFVGFHRKPSQPHVTVTGDELDRQMSGQRLTAAHQQASEPAFERLGSARTLHTDVRVVAATHRDLLAMVQQGTFREDLYYRLHIFPLTVPPLRTRRDDIPVLVQHFAQRYAHQMHKPLAPIPAEAMEALVHYDWPGNVRELQHVIERAVILSANGVLCPQVPARSPGARSAAPVAPQSETL